MSEIAAPVERRLTQLRDLWLVFTKDQAARVCCWELDPNSVRLAQGFVAVEGSEGGQTTTLFLPIEAEFEAVSELWEALPVVIAEVWAEVAHQIAGLSDEAKSWSPPARAPNETEGEHALRVCAQLAALPGVPWEHVALSVLPAKPLAQKVHDELISALVLARLPEKVRALLWCLHGEATTPYVESPNGVAAPWSAWRQDRPELNWPGLVDELVAIQPTGGQGDQVRQGLTHMMTALARSDAAGADRAYAQAMAEATREGWLTVMVGLELAYSQSLRQRGDAPAAMMTLERAFSTAQLASYQGDRQGLLLEAQSLMAIASAQALDGDYAKASDTCAAAGLRANTMNDPLLIVETWRASADFAVSSGDVTLGWSLGVMALNTVPTMTSAQMQGSSLGLLLELLQRLAPDRDAHEQEALSVVVSVYNNALAEMSP
jgi:hypothetical protein